MGFRLIFYDLVNSHKPLVGHNCMYDIMFLLRWLDKGPLETELSQFKSKLHELLPCIYDTKYIAESGMIKGQNYDRTSLSDLYSQMKESLTWTTLPPPLTATTNAPTTSAATGTDDVNATTDTSVGDTTTASSEAVTYTILHTMDTTEPTPISKATTLSPISFTFSPDTPKYTPSTTTSNTTSSIVKEQFHDAG